ncbi:hypothetical protein ACGF0J_02850 [Nonomuraea sp. NPDC047897]|uniref:hypothetical protein n=1 Tax=Nonomuraea sp. NPDC047897 TaxID=3364346 RepID=UPI00371587BF
MPAEPVAPRAQEQVARQGFGAAPPIVEHLTCDSLLRAEDGHDLGIDGDGGGLRPGGTMAGYDQTQRRCLVAGPHPEGQS